MTQPLSEVGSDVRGWLEDLAETAPAGCFVEVGVYRGGTAWHLARAARKRGAPLYLYDTFSGMPFSDEGDSHQVGDFSDTSLERVKEAIPDAICVPGVFPESKVDMPPIAFFHADCDQYRSIKACIDLFEKSAVPGAILVFDDYPFLPAAIRAVEERYGDIRPQGGLKPGRKCYVVKK